MKNEKKKAHNIEFVQINDKNNLTKQGDFTIKDIKTKSFKDHENSLNRGPNNDDSDNKNNQKNKRLESSINKSPSNSNKFENLESEKSESSEPKYSLNSIELILESGKSYNSGRWPEGNYLGYVRIRPAS